jgi:hypothetical protein
MLRVMDIGDSLYAWVYRGIGLRHTALYLTQCVCYLGDGSHAYSAIFDDLGWFLTCVCDVHAWAGVYTYMLCTCLGPSAYVHA